METILLSGGLKPSGLQRSLHHRMGLASWFQGGIFRGLRLRGVRGVARPTLVEVPTQPSQRLCVMHRKKTPDVIPPP